MAIGGVREPKSMTRHGGGLRYYQFHFFDSGARQRFTNGSRRTATGNTIIAPEAKLDKGNMQIR